MVLKFRKENKVTAVPPLLRLPLELRRQIYSYLLPKTVKLSLPRREQGDHGREIAWERGNIALLVVNRQLHHETMAMLYGGTNVFVLQVDYDGTRFLFQRLMKSGLIPKQTPRFLDKIQLHNVRYLKHVLVNVNHVDSYTGMINYNCGGRGLTSGLRLQVKKLVDVLNTAEELTHVHVHLIDHGFTFGMAKAALEPFIELQNVRDRIEITGVDNPGFLDEIRLRPLEQKLAAASMKESRSNRSPDMEHAVKKADRKANKSIRVLPDLALSNFYQEHQAAPKEFQGFSK